MKEKQMVTGMEIDPSSTPLKQCTMCIQAKHHINPFPKESQTECKAIGDMTYMDIYGDPLALQAFTANNIISHSQMGTWNIQ
jgi:hypothetical protein